MKKEEKKRKKPQLRHDPCVYQNYTHNPKKKTREKEILRHHVCVDQDDSGPVAYALIAALQQDVAYSGG